MGGLARAPGPRRAARLIRWVDALKAGPLASGEARVWLVEPAGAIAAEALRRVRPTAADHADAALHAGEARGAERLRRRLLLRVLAAAALGVAPDAVEAAREPGGRPAIRAPRPLHAAVARRDGWAALAIAASPVGVDLERPISPAPLDLLPEAERAQARAASPDETANRFARLWAAREACLKATGAGLDGAPAISARLLDARRAEVRGPWGVVVVELRSAGALVIAAVVLPVAGCDRAAAAV